MRIFILFLLVFFSLYYSAQANDSAGAVSSGGIQFHKTEGIIMEKENLFISPDLIKVSYVFKNITDKDISTELFFPLPVQPILSAHMTWDKEVLEEMKEQEIRNHPDSPLSESLEKRPFEDFSVLVGGKKIPFKTEVRALKDGKDITSLLQQHNLPISPILALCDYPIEKEEDSKACDERKKRYQELGLLAPDGKVLWQKQVHYHWKQTFPKGKEVKIEHSYRPAHGFFFFVPDSQRSPVETMMEQTLSRGGWMAKFCPWDSLEKTKKFIPWLINEFQVASKATKTKENCTIMFYDVEYILTTGANWQGPIRDFTLTIQYPKGGTIASCWPFDRQQIEVLDNNQLRIHQKNFTPRQDLKILFGAPCSFS